MVPAAAQSCPNALPVLVFVLTDETENLFPCAVEQEGRVGAASHAPGCSPSLPPWEKALEVGKRFSVGVGVKKKER